MTPTLELNILDAANPTHMQTVADLWNTACGADLEISPRFAAYNLRPSAGGTQIAWLAQQNGHPVGFVAASFLNDLSVVETPTGWLDAIVVTPEAQGGGIGRALLQQAENWLTAQGATSISIGAGIRPFVPGVPEVLNTLAFFQKYGYGINPTQIMPQWDLAADLGHYQPPRTVREIDGLVRPAQRDDIDAMLTYFQREFPDRWRYEFEQFVAEGGRISDYMVLWTARGVDGCCLLTFEDSFQPIERFYPYRLPRPWGQLGSIGVSADIRGQGYGAALLDAGLLRRLHNNGINGCVIDWTDLLDFYAKFGFHSYRTYQIPLKSL